MNKLFFNRLNKIVMAVVYAIAVFFGFGFIEASAATCNYSATLSADKTFATTSDTVKFTTVVTRQSSDLSSCANSVTVELLINANGKSVVASPSTGVSISFTGNNGTTATTPYVYKMSYLNGDLSNAGTSISSTNTVGFSMGVFSGATKVATSPIVNVSLSGTVGNTGSGSLAPQVYFQPAKSVYNQDETISVNVHIDSGQWSNVDSSVQNIYFALYVNGKSIGGFNQTRSNFQASDQYYDNGGQGFPITAQNGFVNGSNTITVRLFISGSSTGLGQGTAVLQAQGFATNPGANPGTTNPGSNPGTTNPGANPGAGGGSQVDCSKNPNANYCIYNPLNGVNDILTFLLKMIQFALGFIGTLAVLFIIIGGFRMVLAQGNEEAYGVARKTVTWAVLGLVIAVLSFSIVTIVSNILKSNVQQVGTTQNNETNTLNRV